MNRLSLAQVGRRSMVVFITAIMVTLLVGGAASAQTSTTTKINVGDTVTGTIDNKSFSQVYSFDAKSGDLVTITATSKAKALALALVVTDSAGKTLEQAVAAPIKDLKIDTDGTYYITVLRSTGVTGATGDYTLTLASTNSGPSTTITLDQGIQIDLAWSTDDDMNLEVRDPVGGSVNFHTPKVTSGGELTSGNVNGDCTKAQAAANTETVKWPQGSVPRGSYEIIIYYNQACAKLSTGQTPAPLQFTATVTVNGTAQDPIRGTLNLGEEYVDSFILDSATSVTVQPGGVISGSAVDTRPFTTKIAAPVALPASLTATGTIDHNNGADAYSFDAKSGQAVTIDLNATSGSLDPYLLLLDQSGNILTSNDDASVQTRNSEILNQPINADGRYTILATRFALAVGGTEGNYSLKVKLGTQGSAPRATTAPTVQAIKGTSATAAPPTSGILAVTLTWNSTADARLLVRDPSGVSIFSDALQPNATSGVMTTLGNLNCKNTSTSPAMNIYWPDGTQPAVGDYEIHVWQASACDTPATVATTYTLTVTLNGTQVLQEKGRPDPNGAIYLTTFTIDDQGVAAQGKFKGLVVKDITKDAQFIKDLNGDAGLIKSAQPLAYNTPVTGTIDRNTPYVVYTLTVVTNDHLRFTLNNRSGGLDPDLFLIQAGGSGAPIAVDSNDDFDKTTVNSRFDYTFKGDGTYLVVATHYGIELGGTEGQYELTATKLNK